MNGKEIVTRLRDMDRQIICGGRMRIFREAADLIEKQDLQIEELMKALETAEIALVNSIPTVPYPGDGPLVSIRIAMAKSRTLRIQHTR